MFKSIIDSQTQIAFPEAMLCIACAMVIGVLVAGAYMLTQRKKKYNKDLIVTLAILPSIVCIIIIMVGSSIARALSLAGAFALVRFRSAPGSARDIAMIFLSMASGLACGLGFVVPGAVFALSICAIYVILCNTRFGENRREIMQLKITIPENMNYQNVFDDIFEKYLDDYSLHNVKTTNMGSLYELTYQVEKKPEVFEKDMIDEIRCRNGNLNVSFGMIPDKCGIVL